ncbi:MAG: DUF4388 domain-containing protein [Myxococcales bacterium]|nr:DUF4388 domain-containing protein [Myxococcales bacterium]
MSVALRGNLKDFGIGEVFQLIGQQRKTGILEFSAKGEQIRICFDRGAVVSAAPVGPRPDSALGDMLVRCGYMPRPEVDRLLRDCDASAQPLFRLAVSTGRLNEGEIEEVDSLLTRDTIFAVLRWSNGSFDFRAQDLEHDRKFESLLGAEQILMDGMRMADEWQSFAEFVPSQDLVFARRGSFDAYRQAVRGEAYATIEDAQRVFQMIDGRLAVRRVVDLSRLGTFDATRIIADLHRLELIEPVDPSRVRRPRVPMISVSARRWGVRSWLPALLPLALLLAVAVWANRDVPAEGVRAIAVDRAPLESVRQAYAARRVRNGTGSYRFIAGRWPRELGELEDLGLIEGGGLASRQGRPYYYEHRNGGVLLLAPER